MNFHCSLPYTEQKSSNLQAQATKAQNKTYLLGIELQNGLAPRNVGHRHVHMLVETARTHQRLKMRVEEEYVIQVSVVNSAVIIAPGA